MKLPWFVIGGVPVLLFAGGSIWLHSHDNRVRAEARVADSLRVTQRLETALRDSDAAQAKVTHTDTIRVEHWQPIYHTVHDTLLKNVHDTITVERFVQVADSTIQACSQLVTDCQERTRILVAEKAACQDEVGLWKRQAPNVWQRHETAVVVTSDVITAILTALAVKHL